MEKVRVYMKIKQFSKNIGPGIIITAAFIGPGTITTCIKAGYENGYSPIGIILFSIVIAIIVQIFAAKLGLITQNSMSQNIKENNNSFCSKLVSILFVVLPIFLGCSSFETGNITGAVVGLRGMIGDIPVTFCILIISASVFFVLLNDTYRKIEKILGLAVFIMAICFIVSAVLIQPDWKQVFLEIFYIDLFNYNTMIIGSLLGTTIGAYNIFLHSELVAKHWHKTSDFKYMIFDTIFSIGLGGIISCCIIIVAGTIAKEMKITQLSIENFATILYSPLGNIGQIIFYIGLFAAGFTSAITAPLAASYTIVGIICENNSKKTHIIKCTIWIAVILIGAIFSMVWGSSPQELIVIVQITNAIILPLIMIFLLKSLNSKQMGKYKNRLIENIVLVILILVCSSIGVGNIYHIFIA